MFLISFKYIALPEDGKNFSELSAEVQSYSRCQSSDYLEPLIIEGNFTGSEKCLLNRIICHPCNKPTVLNLSGERYILPADCNFLMSDAENLGPLVNYAQGSGGYKLLVLDPPWFNKSAKRGSKYSFMSMWQIKSLPVPCLLAPGALVGIWVTNKQKYLRFTRSELFPHWSVELMAEWFWVKVTKKGELVTDLDSPHKKPYEPLLLGRFIPKMDGLWTSCDLLNKAKKSSEKEMESIFVDKGSLNGSSLPTKRKKVSDNDDVIGTEYTCDINKNTATEMSLEWKPPSIYYSQDHEYNGTGVQNPRKHWLNCQGVYNKDKMDIASEGLNSSSDVVQKQQTVQKVRGQRKEGNVGISEHSLNISSVQSEPKEPEPEPKPKLCDLLPYHQIICSVPCKIHSRKPPLHEIFSKYVPPNSLCLEMFARNLTPHWTSWGNEVLKFQSMEYFEESTTEQVPRKIQEEN